MDNHKRLIIWFFESKHRFEAEVKNYTWPETCGIDLYDFAVIGRYSNSRIATRGSDPSKSLALIKAISEFLERAILIEHRLGGSNGCAVHFDQAIAKENAICELVEREAFFLNWYSGREFLKIGPGHELLSHSEVLRGIEQVRLQSGELNYYYLGEILGRQTVAAIANGRNCEQRFGVILGMGSSRNLEDATLKAGRECFRNFMACSLLGPDFRSEEEFYKKTRWAPSDQSNLARNPYWSEMVFEPAFHQKDWDGSLFKASSVEPSAVEFIDKPVDFLELPFDFHFVQAKCSSFQPFHFGPFDRSNLNLAGLENYRSLLKVDDPPREVPHILA